MNFKKKESIPIDRFMVDRKSHRIVKVKYDSENNLYLIIQRSFFDRQYWRILIVLIFLIILSNQLGIKITW